MSIPTAEIWRALSQVGHLEDRNGGGFYCLLDTNICSASSSELDDRLFLWQTRDHWEFPLDDEGEPDYYAPLQRRKRIQ